MALVLPVDYVVDSAVIMCWYNLDIYFDDMSCVLGRICVFQGLLKHHLVIAVVLEESVYAILHICAFMV